MQVRVQEENTPCPIIRLSGKMVHHDSCSQAMRLLFELATAGAAYCLLDCRDVSRVSHSGLAGFLRLFSDVRPLQLGLVRVSRPLIKKIQKVGLADAFPIFSSESDAYASPQFRRIRLSHVSCAILAGDPPTRLHSWATNRPMPLLDVLGRSVLGRQIDHLQEFGLGRIHLGLTETSHHLADFSCAFRSARNVFISDVRSEPDQPSRGTASALKSLQDKHLAFAGDFLVVSGNILTTLDYSELVARHEASGELLTAVTVDDCPSATGPNLKCNAKGQIVGFANQSLGQKTVRSAGIFMMSPDVLDFVPGDAQWSIVEDLVPAILKHGYSISTFAYSQTLQSVASPKSYLSTTAAYLEKGKVWGNFSERYPHVYVAEGADVSAKAKISGQCYIGRGAQIAPGARLIGPVSVGDGSVVAPDCFLKRAIVLNSTCLEQGDVVENGLAVGDAILGEEGQRRNLESHVSSLSPNSLAMPDKSAVQISA